LIPFLKPASTISSNAMSYDVFFWREQAGTTLEPRNVLGTLDDTVGMPGIVALPRDAVTSAFRKHFPDISVGDAELEWDGDGSYFRVGFKFLNEQQITLCAIYCGYELLKSPSAMRLLVAVASSLGCRFYDPQRT
jgi:hypothetical protein